MGDARPSPPAYNEYPDWEPPAYPAVRDESESLPAYSDVDPSSALDAMMAAQAFRPGAGFRPEQFSVLRTIAERGDAGHVERLLREGSVLPLLASRFLSSVIAHNPEATRTAMIERLLRHPLIGGNPSHLGEALQEAARQGLPDVTQLLLAKNATRRTEAKALAFQSGHPEVAVLIGRHIEANPRNRLSRFVGGLFG